MDPRTLRPLLVVAAGLILASPASAKIVRVFPGPGTPLQDAIDAAAPGDTLRLELGRYPEAIVVTKRLRILGGSSTIDAECNAAVAVTVAADRVRLERLRIVGATLAQVEVDGRDGVALRGVRSAPTCEDVEYAVSATGATRLTVVDGAFFPFHPDVALFSCPDESTRRFAAAVRISATPAGGQVRVTKTFSCLAEVGVLVEDAASAPRTRAPVKVERNVLFGNGRGIVLQDVDGSSVRANEVQGGAGTLAGIEVDAGSDDNALLQNRVQGHPTDVGDAGTSNCWRGTKFTTGSVPATGCP